MPNTVVGFDLYPHVCYEPIEKLSYGAFPYKVIVKEDFSGPSDDKHINDALAYQQWRDHAERRRAFYYMRRRYLPQDAKTYRDMNNGTDAKSFSFFFMNKEDCLYFVKKNKKYVTKVFRPESDAEIEVLRENKRLVLRDMLFWNKYRFAVEFKEQMSAAASSSLVEDIRHIFNEEPDDLRYYFSVGRNSVLYLNDAHDVVHVKLAIHEKVKSYSETILRSEISR
jgi:hypothetical protein